MSDLTLQTQGNPSNVTDGVLLDTPKSRPELGWSSFQGGFRLENMPPWHSILLGPKAREGREKPYSVELAVNKIAVSPYGANLLEQLAKNLVAQDDMLDLYLFRTDDLVRTQLDGEAEEIIIDDFTSQIMANARAFGYGPCPAETALQVIIKLKTELQSIHCNLVDTKKPWTDQNTLINLAMEPLDFTFKRKTSDGNKAEPLKTPGIFAIKVDSYSENHNQVSLHGVSGFTHTWWPWHQLWLFTKLPKLVLDANNKLDI